MNMEKCTVFNLITNSNRQLLQLQINYLQFGGIIIIVAIFSRFDANVFSSWHWCNHRFIIISFVSKENKSFGLICFANALAGMVRDRGKTAG